MRGLDTYFISLALRKDGGPGSGPQGGGGSTLHLKSVEAGAKNAFRTRNLQKETGQTPAKIRALLAKAGVPGPTEGKVWWFHNDDRATIVAIIKNGGKLPEGHTEAKFVGKSEHEKIGTTPKALVAKVEKIPQSHPLAEHKEAIKAVVEQTASPIKSEYLSSVPPPPPSMTTAQLANDLPNIRGTALNALKSYTGSRYKDINKFLRKGPPPQESKIVADMDKAFDKVAEKGGLSGGVTVYRGMRSHNLQIEGISLTEGTVIHDKGFMSTSAREGAAKRFGNVHFEIDVPKGTKAAYLERVSKHTKEKELLLARGTKIRIKSVTVVKDAYGNITSRVKAEVVHE